MTPGKTAFITGISGQDGYYLSRFLLKKGYEVHGLVRPSSKARRFLTEFPIEHLKIHYGDILDLACLIQILQSTKIDEVYHLAAQSHVGISFDLPLLTNDINAMGTLRLLNAITILGLQNRIKFYNACTSEVFGQATEFPQSELTPMRPVSPYAISKVASFWHTVNVREAYGMFAANGILFNHESERRGTDFVSRKITTAVAMIMCGTAEFVELGNLDAKRDWGSAQDYVRGIHAMLQHSVADDFVLATGENWTVREFAEEAFLAGGICLRWEGEGFCEVGIDSASSVIRVRVNPKFYRPLETTPLLGSSAKAERILGWKREISFPELVRSMVEYDLAAVKNGSVFSHPV